MRARTGHAAASAIALEDAALRENLVCARDRATAHMQRRGEGTLRGKPGRHAALMAGKEFAEYTQEVLRRVSAARLDCAAKVAYRRVKARRHEPTYLRADNRSTTPKRVRRRCSIWNPTRVTMSAGSRSR